MKVLTSLAAALALVTLAAGCGQRRGPDGLTEDERARLNEIAVSQDNQIVDASPDSLVANEELTEGEAPAAIENGAAASNTAAANAQ